MMNKSLTANPVTDEYSGSGSRDDNPEVLEKWKTSVIGQVVYLSLIFAVGTVSNLIIAWRGLCNRKNSQGTHHSAAMATTNMLVISLALSNLGTSTFSVGIVIFPLYVPNTPVNSFTCSYIWPLRELFVGVSCYALTFIALGRYLILFKSFRNIKVFSSPMANTVCLWILSYLVFALPFAAGYKPVDLNGTLLCDTFWASPQIQRAYVTFISVVHSLLPPMVVCFSYFGIIRRLRRARNIVSPEMPADPGKKEETALSLAVHSLRIIKLSIMLLISFIITFVPYAILALALDYGKLDPETFPEVEDLHAFVRCLVYSGAVMDPLIIMYSSSLYRPGCGILRKLCRP